MGRPAGRALKTRWPGTAPTTPFPISDVEEILPGIIEQAERVFYTMGAHPEFDSRLIGWVTALRSRGSPGTHTPDEFIALDHMLHDLRLYKSRAEITCMRRAAAVAVKAHLRAMAFCRPGLFEYEIEAEFLHEFRRHGMRPSYLPIVGSGPNACILHYSANDRQMQRGRPAAGGRRLRVRLLRFRCDAYLSGEWAFHARAARHLRNRAGGACGGPEGAVPGNHWNEPHDAAVQVVTRGLRRLGLLKGSRGQLIRSRAYRQFFMHRTGHWLGMDVHDVGDYKVGDQWRMLEPGMTLTVEPGIYIAAGTKGVAPALVGHRRAHRGRCAGDP